MGSGTADELNGRSVGLEKDLEALDLKAGSERQSNGKEDDGSFDDSDPERQLRRYARDLTRYHRNLFDGVKTREQRKKS
ncbi:hypothetical protein [Phaffia rhodozyma]|uniref:Uncharacterized protein n=1 Tax=Phaffia rhodozyma TaxID=264483 RepID=A0A0F7SUD6_PHARH|nr:hypothetical protein [Phaffia rhodozyma]